MHNPAFIAFLSIAKEIIKKPNAMIYYCSSGDINIFKNVCMIIVFIGEGIVYKFIIASHTNLFWWKASHIKSFWWKASPSPLTIKRKSTICSSTLSFS